MSVYEKLVDIIQDKLTKGHITIETAEIAMQWAYENCMKEYNLKEITKIER